ncbi:TPA: hypothetical protein ACH3X1_016581 [Trebouxia sp. C0004]
MLAASTDKGKAWSGGKSSSPLMLKFGYIVLAVSLCALIVHVHASAHRPAASSQDLVAERSSGNRMDPFAKVFICAPFNVKIVPGADYKVTVTADEVVKDAISTNVQQETLTLEVIRSFRTSKPIQVTVSLPPDQLQLVHNKAPKTSVAVSPGFNVRRFKGVQAGDGSLYLMGLNADEVSLENEGQDSHDLVKNHTSASFSPVLTFAQPVHKSGKAVAAVDIVSCCSMGSIIARGIFKSVQVEGSGVSKIYLKGSMSTVYVRLAGISEVFVDPSTDDVKISGSVDSLSKIHYTRGQCDVGRGGTGLPGVGAMAAGGIGAFSGNMQFGNMANMFGGGCQKVQTIRIPDAEPKWSCGLEMSGRFTCAGMPFGSSASASSSGNGKTYTSTGQGGAMSMSSSSGGGASFSNSNDGENGGSFMYSTGEGRVQSQACTATEADVCMFSDWRGTSRS